MRSGDLQTRSTDLLMAATAGAHDGILVTRNTRDFEGHKYTTLPSLCGRILASARAPGCIKNGIAKAVKWRSAHGGHGDFPGLFFALGQSLPDL
jgi:hypothetical protein